MKASEILAVAAIARKCLTHQQWHIMLVICATGSEGMLFSDISRQRWTGRDDSIKASVTKMRKAGLLTYDRYKRGGSRYRNTRRLTATPKAYRLLGLQPETPT